MAPSEFPADTEDYGCVPISGNGQLTIPKPARQALGLNAGDRIYIFASTSKKRAWLVITDKQGRQIARYLSGE